MNERNLINTAGKGGPCTQQSPKAQRGAALLMAMVIVTLVSTLAASMVWQQWRATQVEGAERVRAQASWVLSGALDWARLILKEDGRKNQTDDLGEVWAVPLAEARLSTFLAADSNNNSATEDDAPEAFMSGGVTDAHARYNLRNMIDTNGKPKPDEVKVLQRLCGFAGLQPSLAVGMADALQKAFLATQGNDPAVLTMLGGAEARAQAALMPKTFDQLLWLGLDAGTLERLRPYITILPAPVSTVNVNTASAEVIAAVVDGLDVAVAARVVQARQRTPLKDVNDVAALLGPAPANSTGTGWDTGRLGVNSQFFEVRGRLRYEDNIIEQRHLVERTGSNDVIVRQQTRFSGLDPAAQGGSTP